METETAPNDNGNGATEPEQPEEGPSSTPGRNEEPAADGPPAEAKADEPIVVEEVDRLKAENAHLRAMSSVQQETIAQQKINEANHALTQASQVRAQRTQELQLVRKEIEEKYNIDLDQVQVREGDGVVIPRPQQQVPPQVLQRIQEAQRQAQKG